MGITPACAGNRCPRRRPWSWGWDHPRVCGEQEQRLLDRAVREGSPPRVRGTDAESLMERGQARITPACAGNRPISSYTQKRAWDHPRVCGEQCVCIDLLPRHLGSPPRVRGTGCLSHSLKIKYRITPACAGNSPAFTAAADPLKDHPRVCGEQ